jgi:putative two-component system response regulator
VDDNEVALAALGQLLREGGYEVIEARSGREALCVMADSPCRIVISDWVMPEMDGLELCRRLRSDDFGGYVYVILLTARNAIDDVVEGLSSGADDFLTKPFHPEELRCRVRAGERILALETRDVAIFAMAKLAESRDPETGQHLDRIRTYARLLAQELVGRAGLGEVVDAEFVRLIYLTSPLHDIGKIGIPDSVLLKPGRLSDREFEIMKTHAQIGADTLEAALRQYPGIGFLRMARDIALTHHERFGGSGYPNGLRGQDIPLSGRIVALADVYDALTTRRVYKGAFTHELAATMIVQESETHFDPVVVEAFQSCAEQFACACDNRSQSRFLAAEGVTT